MIEDDQEHSCRAEEDGKTVEVIVGNHLETIFARDREFADLDGIVRAT